MINRSACVPVNTGISIGTLAVYGLFNLTPKFLSPLKSNKMKTPICTRPTLAIETKIKETDQNQSKKKLSHFQIMNFLIVISL